MWRVLYLCATAASRLFTKRLTIILPSLSLGVPYQGSELTRSCCIGTVSISVRYFYRFRGEAMFLTFYQNVFDNLKFEVIIVLLITLIEQFLDRSGGAKVTSNLQP